MAPPNDDDVSRKVMHQLAADFAAGNTLGALHERVTGLSVRLEEHRAQFAEHRDEFREHVKDDDELRKDVQGLREARAREEGAQEERRRSFTNEGPTGTGRFNIVPIGDGRVHVEPVPPPAIVAVNVGTGANLDTEHAHVRRHASLRPIVLPSWLSRVLRTGTAKVVGLVLAAILGALAHHFGITLTASTRELPVPSHESPHVATP